MSVNHYENFPVASLLLPARLRPAVAAIYAFARSADDLADEGDAAPEARLAALKNYDLQLERISRRESIDDALFLRLSAVIEQYRLPMRPFHDLLSAFSQDVNVTRHDTFRNLLDYCGRSANPVGRLMLHLYDAASPGHLAQSDAICTALQLINFWQDVAVDWRKNRVYLPCEDLQRFGVTEAQLADGVVNEGWHALMQFEIERTRAMMHAGAALALSLPGRIGWELRLVVQGGLRILEKIEAVEYDVFRCRPVLTKGDWPLLAWRAARMNADS